MLVKPVEMKKLLLITLLSFALFSCKIKNSPSSRTDGEIKIEWIKNLKGDFSFQKEWSYPEGVYKNEFGQLSCDGLCPPETDAMKDNAGKIYKDSLKAFYQLVDTTHQFHSIQSKAWCYEWAGTDFFVARQKSKDSVECYTEMNMATHCSLNLDIINGSCYPGIELNSITSSDSKIYKCSGGSIKIDEVLWKQGIIKAEFSFNFHHPEKPAQPMYWKGKIYAKIEKK